MNEDKIVSIVDYVVTETVIEPNTSVTALSEFLKKRKTTGKVQFDMSRGGNQRYLLTEKTKLTNAQSEAVRKILGWNGNGS